MAYINQPEDLRRIFQDLDNRLRKIETATRFTAPDVSTEPTYPRTGDIIFDNTPDQMKYWNGTEWVVFADDYLGVPKIAFTSTWTGTGLAFTGTPATGFYSRVGKMIFFTIRVNCTTVTNFGTGDYSLTLPAGLTPSIHNVVDGGLHHVATGAHYMLSMDIVPSTSTAELYYPQSNGTMARMDFNSPHTLQTADFFYFTGMYFLS
jgi:hypothetical protein